ncbi:MAG: nuclear transport factor 2 family protein [Lysobacterales bacterium]
MDANDKLDIHEVLARTVFGLDQRDPAMIEVCFTEDARFILEIKDADAIPPFEGREAIMELMVDSMTAHREDRRHLVSNIFVEAISAAEARVVSTLTAFRAEHGKISIMTSGVYRDQLRKVDGEWRIALRHLALDVAF